MPAQAGIFLEATPCVEKIIHGLKMLHHKPSPKPIILTGDKARTKK